MKLQQKKSQTNNGKKAAWNSNSALFLSEVPGPAIELHSSLDRYDMLRPLSEGEDLFQSFDPVESTEALSNQDFEDVLSSLLQA